MFDGVGTFEEPQFVVGAPGNVTSGGAIALGLPGKGRLGPGADADMIAIDGDPSTDPGSVARILRVWRAGEPVTR